ncbi:PDDEXK-like family protein [Paenimyroides aestuarii]|uniref:PD-(D/E)XK nuclease family protein n=1 Tax=Paenimyroides aestuarii TaxID=2968490 RepID=A0ABY5NUC6_9FLAO|nr:PD-(D/E)XK nuclease family protein [Paenimyroides aestuarii]UUV21944.1 PD-(D/E)XK nuclease family protein [Paenimyroides aestuarii]
MDIKQIENLLEKTQIIRNKYADLAEYTGENFNVFNILRLDEKELMHSAFIANLLNVKGNHGQKDVFLKLFINEIKDLFSDSKSNRELLEEFDALKSFAKEEEYIGMVDYDLGNGGRIDITVKDGKNVILIENKINHFDEYKQLIRYNEFYKNAPIIYLTPFGTEPSEDSKGILENNKDFICISYEQHIVNWIEQCIKEMANKPIIRETLNQYLHLVKKITNQTTNDKMKKELTDLVLSNEKNYNAYNDLLHNQNEILKKLISDSAIIFIDEIIKVIASRNGLKVKIDNGFLGGEKETGITFYSDDVLKDLCIDIEFQENGLRLPAIACSVNQILKSAKHENLALQFQNSFHNGLIESKHPRFIFSLFKNSNEMFRIQNINLLELKFNLNKISDLIEDYDNIIKKILSIVQNEY